ncbi:hypothetical protein GO013_07335 [Pseudodesulfovibrio sp. JC047]|uniref:hypothetical protein n=1 Tax=Pseudodesulfovibrio sp. JC047 TaxID=2683199 RepID=UPI0013D11391|nr:hypothetical protein [Pseudodesulfovibrio sp. JC047]NDV19231.1 hypothetical protein [Pseudodesulfovibrio sp. JC047]
MTEDIKQAVREAVREELKAANIIDGPTHIRHHEFIDELCESFDTVKKTTLRVLVNCLVLGVIAAVLYYARR